MSMLETGMPAVHAEASPADVAEELTREAAQFNAQFAPQEVRTIPASVPAPDRFHPGETTRSPQEILNDAKVRFGIGNAAVRPMVGPWNRRAVAEQNNGSVFHRAVGSDFRTY